MKYDSELFLLLDNEIYSRYFNNVLVIAILKYIDNFVLKILLIQFIFNGSLGFLNISVTIGKSSLWLLVS